MKFIEKLNKFLDAKLSSFLEIMTVLGSTKDTKEKEPPTFTTEESNWQKDFN